MVVEDGDEPRFVDLVLDPEKQLSGRVGNEEGGGSPLRIPS